MPSTIYKGDLAEVAFAPETGISIIDDNSTVVIASASTQDVIRVSGGTSGEAINTHILQYPKGMLVGSKLVFINDGGALDAADIDGSVFTITGFHPGGKANGEQSYTEITISPAMTTAAATNFNTGDGFEILPFGTPPIDVTQSFTNPANTSDEACKIDQFLGIATAITLPETKVDLKRYHVVGLGRDVSVQVPGKFITEGGSFEVNMHTARWLKYCLGKEAVHGSGEAIPSALAIQAATSIDATNGTAVGQSSITLDDVSGIVVGDYICILDATTTSVVSDHEPGTTEWDGDDFSGLFDNAQTNEYRRVVGFDTSQKLVHLDEPLSYPHEDDDPVTVYWYIPRATGVLINNGSGYSTGETGGMTVDTVDATTKIGVGDVLYADATGNTRIGVVTAVATTSVTVGNGIDVSVANNDELFVSNAPHLEHTGSNQGNLTFKTLNGITHLLYSKDTLPSFCLEVSQRRRDSRDGDTSVADGSAADSKELTRVYRGCKVKDWTISTDNDAALKLALNFDSAFCYTDTGRLENQILSVSITSGGSGYSATTAGHTGGSGTGATFTYTVSTGAINSISAIATKGTGYKVGDVLTVTGGGGNATLTVTGLSNGSRYTPHRMFDDTANNQAKRYVSGIGKGTQKPFMFYNGTMKLAGQTIAQVTNFTLTGNTGLTTHYAINGADTPASSSLDQVPFSGSRNPALLVEGQTSYDMSMEIIVDDPIFFHKMRTATEFTNSTENQIVLEFTKQGPGSNREKMSILIDDYYIIEAPIQIPEDKGAVKSALKVMPKAVKVVCRDSILKY